MSITDDRVIESEAPPGEPAADTAPLSVSSYRYPTGWYVVGWSGDVSAGTLRPLHYFGRDLICFRGESGTVSVMDA